MERGITVHARAYRQALSALLAAAVMSATISPALAAPKGPKAKAEFDRGVAAYTQGDYNVASEALGKSFTLEPDVETLYAWAQTERKLERCDTASELYAKLLTYDLPAENKAAIRVKLDECKTILAAQAPAPASDPVEPTTPTPMLPPTDEPAAPTTSSSSRWSSPVGLTLIGLGVVGLGTGGVLLMQARTADDDKKDAPNYGDYQRLHNTAQTRGKYGVIAAFGGAGLLATGLLYIAMRGPAERNTQVTGWVQPDGGGVVATGRF